MISENLTKRVLRLRYKMMEDGKEKSILQNYAKVKLTSNVTELYTTAASIRTLIAAPSVDIEKDDLFTLVDE